MLRSDLVTRARDYLSEETADIWSENQLNRFSEEEIRSLPSKNVYLEEIWTMTSVADQQDYALPSGTSKVELVERNDGTDSKPDWVPVNGCRLYGGALYLPFRPSQTDSYRAYLKKAFTIVSDDLTTIDVPNDKTELVVWGMVVRGYKELIGYLRGSQSWDSVTKPNDLSIPVVQNWLREAKEEYKDLLQQYRNSSLPKDINLVS